MRVVVSRTSDHTATRIFTVGSGWQHDRPDAIDNKVWYYSSAQLRGEPTFRLVRYSAPLHVSIVGEMVDEKLGSSFHNDAELWVWGPSQSDYDARSTAVNLTVRLVKCRTS